MVAILEGQNESSVEGCNASDFGSTVNLLREHDQEKIHLDKAIV
jgi:hypothetical protein